MKGFLMEVGNELFKYSPAGGAWILDAVGAITLTSVTASILIIYACVQVAFLVWKWKRERGLSQIREETLRVKLETAKKVLQPSQCDD